MPLPVGSVSQYNLRNSNNVMLSLLLQDTAAVFIYFSGVVTCAEVCICAWDIVAVINSLIAGF